jgi:dihydrofolate synthase / folylpolyglutamate synthase
MIIKPIKTELVLPSQETIFQLLDKNIDSLEEKSVVAVTSKVVALCEGRVVAQNQIGKDELIEKEADYFLPASASKYNYQFSIKQNTLAAQAGIDSSNGDENYVLWPEDSQKSACQIREYLVKRFALKKVGVVITDSTCIALRWGTVGAALGFSGFKALNNYVGKPDLFGHPLRVSQSGVATGLAAAVVLTMGEGAEQTPLAIISDVPFVQFVDRNPAKEELEHFYVKNKDEDLYAPFLNAIKWQKGRGGN